MFRSPFSQSVLAVLVSKLMVIFFQDVLSFFFFREKKSYKVIMNSLLMFLPLFNIGEEKIHSSVVTFAANPEVRIHFNEALIPKVLIY